MSELLKQSNQSLQEFLDKQEEVERESFVIQDDSSANWALRKIKQAKQQKEDNNALAIAEIEKINAWNKLENEKVQQDIDYFQGLLAAYALKKREENPKFKSQKLPNGRIRFKKQQPNYVYDDDTLLESLKNSGRTDLIKVKETPDKASIKKAFVAQEGSLIDPDTGEFIDGVTVVEREDKFEVITDE